jgi:hypothetical protein
VCPKVEGIANGGSLPDDYLDEIYDRIKVTWRGTDTRAQTAKSNARALVPSTDEPDQPKRRQRAEERRREGAFLSSFDELQNQIYNLIGHNVFPHFQAAVSQSLGATLADLFLSEKVLTD